MTTRLVECACRSHRIAPSSVFSAQGNCVGITNQSYMQQTLRLTNCEIAAEIVGRHCCKFMLFHGSAGVLLMVGLF